MTVRRASRPGPTRRWAVAAGVAELVLTATTGGCSASTALSRSTVAGCVRALPVAQQALHGTGHLIGVHLVSADKLPARVKVGLPAEDDTAVCAVAFRGTFAAGTVTDARRGATGGFAVVLVDEKLLAVIGSFVGDHLPRGLAGHLII